MDQLWERLIERRDESARLQIGAPPYITSAALIHGLETHPEVDFTEAYPAELIEGLNTGLLECALLPVLDAVAIPHGRVIPGLGICTRGPAEADVLFHQHQPDTIQTVEYDPAASMAVALGRVVLNELLGPSIQWLASHHENQYPNNADSRVVCGRNAAHWISGAEQHLDLAEAWTRLTDKPMVHAVWIGRARAPFPRLRQVLGIVARQNESLDDVAPYLARYNDETKTWSKKHLFSSIYYTVGSEEMDAIRDFIEKAAQLNLCNADDKLTLC